MSIVHDIIYKQEAFSNINAQEYFEKLLEQLKRLSDKKIETEALITGGNLKIETLIHLGIITNELFINSLKYGFNQNISNPRVKVILTQKENQYELNYFENGKGMEKDEYKKSFGMDLISTVIEQHNGMVSVEDIGEPWSTHIKVKFSEENKA
jgi:two-component sensor histidine kinase